MERISATDTALSGLRFVVERPRTVAIWGGLYLAISLVGRLLMIVTAGPAMNQVMGGHGDSVALAAVQKLALLYALTMGLALVFFAIIYAAMSRAVLHSDDERFAYLRLGMDEVRQLLLFLLGIVVMIGIYAVLVVGMIVIGLLVGLIAGKGPVASISTTLTVLAALCGMIFIAVRLSLASPLTFDGGRVKLFGSWRLTRGRFWTLLGGYLLTALLAMLIVLLLMVIEAAIAAATGGLSGMIQIFRPDMSTPAAYFTPTRLVILVLGAAAQALLLPVMMMPAPQFYRRLTAETLAAS